MNINGQRLTLALALALAETIFRALGSSDPGASTSSDFQTLTANLEFFYFRY